MENLAMKDFSDKSVLITGGLGFIGSNLAKTLVKVGAKVTVVDSLIPQYGGNQFNLEGVRDKVIINISDIRDSHSMEYLLSDVDYLFNLAGQTSHLDSMKNPREDLDINASAQLSILEVCRKVNPGIKIVYASTRQIYGKPDYLPVDERHPIRPVDVNGINKLAGEWYHLLYNNVYGIKACALRLTNTYGPCMRVKDARQTFLGVWIRLLIEGAPIQIFGDGLQKRDFNYVDDVVDAMMLAGLSNKSNGMIFNLGSSEVVNLNDLAKLMIEIYGNGIANTIPFPVDRKAIDIGDYYSDYSLIHKELGWNPKVPLKSGLQNTLNYYCKNSEYYWP